MDYNEYLPWFEQAERLSLRRLVQAYAGVDYGRARNDGSTHFVKVRVAQIAEVPLKRHSRAGGNWGSPLAQCAFAFLVISQSHVHRTMTGVMSDSCTDLQICPGWLVGIGWSAVT